MKAPAPELFRSGRQLAAWIGLTPKDHSTGGRLRLGVITRAGDEALRSTLVVGATALLQQVRNGRGRTGSPWLLDLLKRKPPKLAAVALANKMARIAWKLMVTGQRYSTNPASIAMSGTAQKLARHEEHLNCNRAEPMPELAMVPHGSGLRAWWEPILA